MKNWSLLIATVFAFSLSSHALAHGDKPKHGGIIQTASDIHFELVQKGNVATIYMEDHGKALPSAGAQGKLIVLNGAEKTEAELEPSGGNMMRTKSDAKLAKGSKVVAQITLANKKQVSVRFLVQ
jgi:hypothetical protein